MRVTQRQLREGEPTIDEMRHDLAERDAVDMDVSQVTDLLVELDRTNYDDEDIREQWERIFE